MLAIVKVKVHRMPPLVVVCCFKVKCGPCKYWCLVERDAVTFISFKFPLLIKWRATPLSTAASSEFATFSPNLDWNPYHAKYSPLQAPSSKSPKLLPTPTTP